MDKLKLPWITIGYTAKIPLVSYVDSSGSTSSSSINNPLFSYESFKHETPDGEALLIKQKEFNYSLFMKVKESKRKIIITAACLEEDELLGEKCLDLAYTAAIEIVLHAINLLYSCYIKEDASQKVYFDLTKDESEIFNSFSCLFRSFNYKNNRASFILGISKYDYVGFIEKTNPVLDRIRKVLWIEQRHDPFLKKYLQTHKKGEPFFKENLVNSIQSLDHSLKSKIINFPNKKKTTSLTPLSENVVSFSSKKLGYSSQNETLI